MNALRRIRAMLVDGGVLVDTQPISREPPVLASGERLGALDMHDWRATIDAVDAETERALAAGLFRLEEERMLVVVDTEDSGSRLVDLAKGFQGTRVPAPLAHRLVGTSGAVELHQDVRLRRYRAV